MRNRTGNNTENSRIRTAAPARLHSRKTRSGLKKRWLVLGAFALFGLLALAGQEKTSADALQEGIAAKILRFHVIANSDSEEDQTLKLEIKDEVVAYMKELLADAETIDDTRALVAAHMDDIRKIAADHIAERGFSYPVNVFLDKRYFPIKSYGGYTFPAGEYEAVCVELGGHSGKNWWCVLYPSLCFVDAVHAAIPEETDEKLQTLLTEEEYQAISQGEVKVRFRFKFLDWLQSLRPE